MCHFLPTDNCLDKHVEQDPHKVALIWEKDEAGQHENITYKYDLSPFIV